jgi:hypothetical protein
MIQALYLLVHCADNSREISKFTIAPETVLELLMAGIS